MGLRTNYATKTPKDGNNYLYVRSTGGNDANSGLTYATAKQTLAGACAAIPDYIDKPLIVYLDGTFTATSESVYVQTVLNDYVKFQGFNGFENVAGPWTADRWTTEYIGDSGAPFAAEAYRGKILHVMTGAEQGYYVIADNTTEDIYPCQHFSGGPGAVQFQIVQPIDVITGTSHHLYLQCSGESPIIFQNLRLTGTTSDVVAVGAQVQTQFCSFETSHRLRITASPNAVLLDTMFFGGELMIQHCNGFTMSRCYVDVELRLGPNVTTFYGISDGSQLAGIVVAQGVNQDHAGQGGTRLFGSPADYFKTTCRASVYLKKSVVTIDDTDFIGGSNHGIGISDSLVTLQGDTNIDGATNNGLFVEDSSAVTVLDNLDISNNTGNAIKLVRASLYANSVTSLTGSGNGGFGLYGENNSYCDIKNGTPPTVTGTGGDISTDGVTEVATWVELDAGLELNIAGKLQAGEQ